MGNLVNNTHCQARELKRSGVSIVAQATGISRVTIYVGLSELDNEASTNTQIRKAGGGRNSITDIYPELLEQLENLIEPLTRGDPESSLRWTCKSTRNIANELTHLGYKVTQRTVCTLLAGLEYSLQSNKKTSKGLTVQAELDNAVSELLTSMILNDHRTNNINICKCWSYLFTTTIILFQYGISTKYLMIFPIFDNMLYYLQ